MVTTWVIEGSTWVGSSSNRDEWESGPDFSFEVEAENSAHALIKAASKIAEKPGTELHTIQCVQLHFGRRESA